MLSYRAASRRLGAARRCCPLLVYSSLSMRARRLGTDMRLVFRALSGWCTRTQWAAATTCINDQNTIYTTMPSKEAIPVLLVGFLPDPPRPHVRARATFHVVIDRERDGRADGVLHEVERDALEEAQEALDPIDGRHRGQDAQPSNW